MPLKQEKDTDVLIVGGGPVGLGLAVELGRRGVRVVLVERHQEPQPIPKGQNLTQRTMEHFYFWGAEAELRAARTIPREYGIGGMTAYGSLLGKYSYDWLQRELVRPFYFTDNERLPQYATEAVLRRRAGALAPVKTLYGWTAEGVDQDADGVNLEIVSHGDERGTLRGSYLIGCDGSRSLVRERADITQTHADHDRLMVLLVFRSSELHHLLERYPRKSFFCVLDPALKGYWKFFGRVDLGTTWFFHAPVPAGTTRENFDFRKFLHVAAGAEFDVEFVHIGFWDLRIATADRYRNGRIFIAGDAAHSHPPYGGYGINTGFEDAVNLGWKLAASLRGWGGRQLLDSYERERRPVFESTARDFIEKAIKDDREFLEGFDPRRDPAEFEQKWSERRSGARSEVHSFAPHYEGSPIVWGPPGGRCSAAGAHSLKAQPGHHLAPQSLSSGRNIFEELSDDFTLAAFGATDEACADFQHAASELRIPLKVLRDAPSGGRERYEANFILVRPDQYVAWAGDTAFAGAAKILRRAIGVA